MRELQRFIVGVVLLVIVLEVLTGHGQEVVTFIVGVLAAVAAHLRTVMIAVALPVLCAGGLLWVSPWHRDLAGRLMAGAVTVLTIAVLGPPFLGWLQAQLATFGGRLFGGGS